MAGLAWRGYLFCFPWSLWQPQCLPGGPATWRAVLVCLPHDQESYPQALSRADRASFARLLGRSRTGARKRTCATPSSCFAHTITGRAAADAALDQACSAASAALAGGAGALATPLTLLSAAAGWGKTTLLSAWASRHKAQVAWLSLDELDNSPP